MILSTKKLTFKEILIVDLPDGSIPIEFKEGKGNVTLWYWEATSGVSEEHTFRFYKKGSEIQATAFEYLGSIWLNRLWWQVYEEL